MEALAVFATYGTRSIRLQHQYSNALTSIQIRLQHQYSNALTLLLSSFLTVHESNPHVTTGMTSALTSLDFVAIVSSRVFH